VRKTFDNAVRILIKARHRMDPKGAGGQLSYSMSISSAAIDGGMTVFTAQSPDLKARTTPAQHT
jgi:hypothetical protein